jgi:predicted esterase YcpF (UPF0227 family)
MNQQLQNPPQPQPDPQIMLEAEKIKSNERIAMLEAQSDEKVAALQVQSDEKLAALKASVELQKVEMQQRFDSIEENYKHISNLLMSLPGTSQVMELESIKEMVAQNKAESDAQMMAVMGAVNRKRKRVPIRDPQSGDIVEVREIDDDEASSAAPVQIGPPGRFSPPTMN